MLPGHVPRCEWTLALSFRAEVSHATSPAPTVQAATNAPFSSVFQEMKSLKTPLIPNAISTRQRDQCVDCDTAGTPPRVCVWH